MKVVVVKKDKGFFGFFLRKVFGVKKDGEYNDFSILAGITFAGRSYIWIRKRKRRDKLYGVPSNEGGNPGLRNDLGHLSRAAHRSGFQPAGLLP